MGAAGWLAMRNLADVHPLDEQDGSTVPEVRMDYYRLSARSRPHFPKWSSTRPLRGIATRPVSLPTGAILFRVIDYLPFAQAM
jgi:hypothetical protein